MSNNGRFLILIIGYNYRTLWVNNFPVEISKGSYFNSVLEGSKLKYFSVPQKLRPIYITVILFVFKYLVSVQNIYNFFGVRRTFRVVYFNLFLYNFFSTNCSVQMIDRFKIHDIFKLWWLMFNIIMIGTHFPFLLHN